MLAAESEVESTCREAGMFLVNTKIDVNILMYGQVHDLDSLSHRNEFFVTFAVFIPS